MELNNVMKIKRNDIFWAERHRALWGWYECRRVIFELYRDIFVCITISVSGVFLVQRSLVLKSDLPLYMGCVLYVMAFPLAILTHFTALQYITQKRKHSKIRKRHFYIILLFTAIAMVILVCGLYREFEELVRCLKVHRALSSS